MGQPVQKLLETNFVCPRCDHQGAQAEEMTMLGTGLSRQVESQTCSYVLVSCTHCGYTEVYNMHLLGNRDNLDTFLELLFGKRAALQQSAFTLNFNNFQKSL